MRVPRSSDTWLEISATTVLYGIGVNVGGGMLGDGVALELGAHATDRMNKNVAMQFNQGFIAVDCRIDCDCCQNA